MKKFEVELPINTNLSIGTTRIEPKPTKDTKRKKYQAMIFVLTYLSYCSLHAAKQGWSILKPDVRKDFGWTTNNNAGIVDFWFLMCYSVGLFISGYLGDNYPIKIIVPIGYLMVSLMMIMVSLGGMWDIDNVLFYVIFFSVAGLCQSVGLPSFIQVIGNWFSKDSRGLVFGLW